MKRFLILIAFLAVNLQLSAQELLIQGIITDNTGLPLPGASVIIKGTSTGTTSDFDGKYEIKVEKGQKLIFSYVGYIKKEVIVGSETKIDVQLESSGELSEVVVVGYGTSSKTHATASSSLRGRASGVSIGNGGGIESGQLTAGEINDIEDWNEWKFTIKKKTYRNFQDKWKFFLQRKIKVVVNNDEGNPVNNVKVSIYTEDNKKIMSSRTDVKGEAIVFLDFDEITEDKFYRIQLEANGIIKGKKILKDMNEVDFVLNTEATSNSVDIMFTIDATGSMGDEINYLKAELKDIMDRVAAAENIDEKRVALTFYRDKGDAYIVKEYDFETNISKVQESLNANGAGGGGDYEEALETALETANSLTWNTKAKSRLMFLILDAPPHFNEGIVKQIKDQVKMAQEKGIKIIPIVASGANKNLEFLMRFFSISTNGTYVFLTDDSGIGNPHLRPSKDDFEVEKLNDLIVRLIKESVESDT